MIKFKLIIISFQVFCSELPIFLREHFNGMYRSDVYFFSKQLAELPIFIIMPIISTTIFYFMAGMNPGFDRFLITCSVFVLLTQIVVSVGYLMSCITNSIQIAIALAPAILVPLMLFGGFFLNNESVPDWLIWLKYLSWYKYSNEILIINQWEGITIDCPQFNSSDVSNATVSGKSCIPDGDGVIEFYGFNKEDYYIDFIALAILAIGFRIIAYLVLLSKTFRKHN